MVSFVTGILIIILVSILSFIIGDWSIVFRVSGIIGLVSFLISALLSGAFISGDRVRANWASESKEDRNIQEDWATKLFLFGVPNLAGAIIYLVILY